MGSLIMFLKAPLPQCREQIKDVESILTQSNLYGLSKSEEENRVEELQSKASLEGALVKCYLLDAYSWWNSEDSGNTTFVVGNKKQNHMTEKLPNFQISGIPRNPKSAFL